MKGISMWSLLIMSFANLRVNWMRSSLTVLGMVFGTAAVIATLSSNEGAKQFVVNEIRKLGVNVIGFEAPSGERLELEDIDYIKAYADDFSSLTMIVGLGPKPLRTVNARAQAELVAASASYFDDLGLELARGRPFDRGEVMRNEMVGVIGSEVSRTLFGDDTPIGKRLVVMLGADVSATLLIIGTLAEKGRSSGADFDRSVVIPLSLADFLSQKPQPPRLLAQIRDENRSQQAKDRVRALMAARFDKPMRVSDAREAIERTQEIWSKQNLIGMILAGISLVTGGVGIMNVMLLSIFQRRREIGLRKAIGAKNRDISLQFLMEAIIVCLAGGVVGVGIGHLFGMQVARMLGQWEAHTNAFAIGLALGFAMLTGVVFGLLPALRASRLMPYDALRS